MKTMILTAEATVAFEDGGSVGDSARRATRDKARALADETGTTVEIAAVGGYILDVVQPSVTCWE
jgi:hypothetical protein